MKINSNVQQKHPTFGVRKTDSVQSFINEIRTTNPNLGDIERLSIVQKMKKSDTFVQLQKEANENIGMFGNKRCFDIANKKGFTTFINSICIKIMQELNTLGKAVKKFIVKVEYEDGKKEEKNIINAFGNRLRVKKHYNNHKDKIKEYCQKNKEKRNEYDKEYHLKNKEKINERRRNAYKLEKQRKEVKECLNNEKTNFMQLDNMSVISMSPNTSQIEKTFDFRPQTSWKQDQTDDNFLSQNIWELNNTID